MNTQSVGWNIIAAGGAIIVLALICGLVIHYVLVLLNRRAAKRSVSILHEALEQHCRKPLKLLLPALALSVVLPAAHLPSQWTGVVEHAIGIIVIASTSWLLISFVVVVSDLILARYHPDERDSPAARRVNTQVQVFRRVFMVIIVVLAGATILMSFSWGRDIGESVLASAGIAGIAVGLAARPTLENVVAGIQLGVTQPISLEDAVIVENDWGWVEEITTTYVVVRTWDLRRWILPLTYFIQHPFQNWTRMSSDLLGTIYVYVDYTAPIDAIREEFTRVVQSSTKWDQKVCVLQVTDATAQTLQLRGLASAATAGAAWDLRCEVREKLIDFIQRNYPQCLPRTRAELRPKGDQQFDGAHPVQ